MAINLYSYILAALHLFLIFIIGLVLLFSMDIFTLFLTSIVLLTILLINYKYDDCPISLIEDKYYNTTSIDLFFNIIGKKYKKSMRPAMTLELLWIGLLLCSEKLLFVLLFRKFILKNIL